MVVKAGPISNTWEPVSSANTGGGAQQYFMSEV